ncbi:MAG: nuclear transport factor 2 family protein [Casimicrobiaceae bacterium]
MRAAQAWDAQHARGPRRRGFADVAGGCLTGVARWSLAAVASLVLAGCATPQSTAPIGTQDRSTVEAAVAARERAFAQTMADRDHAAFVAFLSAEAIFFTAPTPLRGRDAVAAAWRRFYTSAAPPFSWEPDAVQALDSGTLALSTGPVRNPEGKIVARFTSIWRLEPPGVWRVVFDRGNDVCDCATR